MGAGTGTVARWVRKGCNAEKDPRCVYAILVWSYPPYLLALGAMDSVQLLTGAVLTWDRDKTRAPEGI